MGDVSKVMRVVKSAEEGTKRVVNKAVETGVKVAAAAATGGAGAAGEGGAEAAAIGASAEGGSNLLTELRNALADVLDSLADVLEVEAGKRSHANEMRTVMEGMKE